MNRRALVTAVTTVFLVLVSLVGAVPAQAATTHQMFLTFYGWYDNTPPGGDIAYPQIHGSAGGKGTFADPITFATDRGELAPGTKVWVPRVRKYFIMEDACQECSADWNGRGPNGGPGLRHIDLWIGGKGGNAMNAIDCEDALTNYNPDNTPTMEPIVVSPGANEPYDATPIFNTGTGECYGGAQPKTTVGQYRNGANGLCLDNPGNSSTTGTVLKTSACTGAANQRFKFHGAFMEINSLCAGMSGSNIVLQTCTGGPKQQWSVNPNGTISDMQTGGKCFRSSGANLVAGSCSGTASQWVFTSAAPVGDDFSLAVNPASGSVAPGSSATATVSTAVVSGTAQSVALSATGAPAGVAVDFAPASVTAGGSSAMTVATTAATSPGSYQITVTGTAGSKARSATFALTVTGPPGSEPVLLSQGKPATASSVESSAFAATAAVDGNLTSTRWASQEGSDPQWLRVDLGVTANVSRVKLTWEAAYAKSYSIQTSSDGSTWTTVFSTTTGNGATDDLTGLVGSGRYVRVNGTARATAYGYSLYELQVFGAV